jgi:glycosyltransferase involved in cell wall biosynthesis
VKILHILDKLPDGGGTATHVADISKLLRDRGFDISVLRLVGDNPAATGSGVHEYSLPTSYGYIDGRRLVKRMHSLITSIEPDLIHLHGCFTAISPLLVAELRCHWRLVGTLHDIRPFCYTMTRRFRPTGEICNRNCGFGCFKSGCIKPRGIIDGLRLGRRYFTAGRMLDEWRKISRVIVPSTYMQQLAYQHGFSANKLRLIPHGTTVPDSIKKREDATLPPLILFVGSLIDYKGIDCFLRALLQIRDKSWRAEIIGDGPLRQSISNEIENNHLGDRVLLRGHEHDSSKIMADMARARVVVIPSLIPESFSLVGIESLAMATPVVTFGLGGMQDWLREGKNGLLAADSDHIDLASRIRLLLDNAEMAASMGATGHELVKSYFSVELSVEKLSRLYREFA